MELKRTNAQGVSRFLKARGWLPRSTESRKQWAALSCRKSLDEVSVRVWKDWRNDEPDASDIADAAEIAQLLKDNDYEVRYVAGSHWLYVKGKIVKPRKNKAKEVEMDTQDKPQAPADEQERLSRLPKWAREKIVRQGETIEYLKDKLRQGPENANVFADPYSETPRPVGKDPVLRFDTGSDHRLEGFTVRFMDGELHVQGMAPHVDDYLAVFPTGGNTVIIKHTKRS